MNKSINKNINEIAKVVLDEPKFLDIQYTIYVKKVCKLSKV